jgi:hypothetical protein
VVVVVALYVQETLGACSDNLLAVVAFYMQEQEARDLLHVLLLRLGHSSGTLRAIQAVSLYYNIDSLMLLDNRCIATIRRSIAATMVAIVKHYPKKQHTIILKELLDQVLTRQDTVCSAGGVSMVAKPLSPCRANIVQIHLHTRHLHLPNHKRLDHRLNRQLQCS